MPQIQKELIIDMNTEKSTKQLMGDSEKIFNALVYGHCGSGEEDCPWVEGWNKRSGASSADKRGLIFECNWCWFTFGGYITAQNREFYGEVSLIFFTVVLGVRV